MLRIERFLAWFLSCLGAVLIATAFFIIPVNAFADTGSACASSCSGLGGSDYAYCTWNCCVDECQGDSACLSNCCATVCNNNTDCEGQCANATATTFCLQFTTLEDCQPPDYRKCGVFKRRVCLWGRDGPCLCLGFF
jgi:hypothetical protein